MQPLRLLLSASIFFAAWCGLSHAAQFSKLELPDKGGPAILMTGEIVAGDEDAFHQLAETMPTAKVLTTGPGGRVLPAIKIGSEIRFRGWSTLVPQGASCASACSFIWLAGQARMLAAGAQIGFHAMSLLSHGQRAETHELDSYLRTWLGNLGYAFDATATIVNTQAASVRWFDVTELRANGIPTDYYP